MNRSFPPIATLAALVGAVLTLQGGAFAGTVALCMGSTPTITGSGTITGTAGNDVILGSAGADTIDGGDGQDRVCGGDGDDTLNGGPGYDMLSGGAGDDQMDGGEGDDTISYRDAPGAVHANLTTATATGWGDDLIVAEDLTGSAFGDTLIGDGGSNLFIGFTGNDILKGMGGDDTFIDGHGNDTMRGGPGSDWVVYFIAPGPVRINLITQRARGAGHDKVIGIENAHGSQYDDLIIGTDGPSHLEGDMGDDRLEGRGGRDRLLGDEGDDTLIGGRGHDFANGWAGKDRCFAEVRRNC